MIVFFILCGNSPIHVRNFIASSALLISLAQPLNILPLSVARHFVKLFGSAGAKVLETKCMDPACLKVLPKIFDKRFHFFLQLM